MDEPRLLLESADENIPSLVSMQANWNNNKPVNTKLTLDVQSQIPKSITLPMRVNTVSTEVKTESRLANNHRSGKRATTAMNPNGNNHYWYPGLR